MEKHQERRIAAALSATLGALSARVHCLTPGFPFLEPSAQDASGSRLGTLFRGAERNFVESHHACLPSKLTLSATFDPHTAERHKVQGLPLATFQHTTFIFIFLEFHCASINALLHDALFITSCQLLVHIIQPIFIHHASEVIASSFSRSRNREHLHFFHFSTSKKPHPLGFLPLKRIIITISFESFFDFEFLNVPLHPFSSEKLRGVRIELSQLLSSSPRAFVHQVSSELWSSTRQR
ncbi:hypothetical protein LR48_Vigan02g102500 [Vigna angularis]|uniref:Uncharacterized protein n=1 Tax=Phaseolus angularis TaxID=3914 RepID=A0A0L9TWE9_PHAAN|nr:hypothetical protein LR48_Vigan02g102500 [Vigna angularis]